MLFKLAVPYHGSSFNCRFEHLKMFPSLTWQCVCSSVCAWKVNERRTQNECKSNKGNNDDRNTRTPGRNLCMREMPTIIVFAKTEWVIVLNTTAWMKSYLCMWTKLFFLTLFKTYAWRLLEFGGGGEREGEGGRGGGRGGVPVNYIMIYMMTK